MTTPLETLAEALLDCRKYASGAEASPEAILWCDSSSEFLAIMPALRARLPNLLTFGSYEPAPRIGPASLRAAAGRHVSGIEWPADEPAIIYIPGHGREILRGAEECPTDLAPLVWFAVAGNFFGQPKQARDWTLRGFLAARGSPVGLDIPEDKATREALGRAATRLFTEPVDSLKGRLDAAALDGLLVPDPVSDVLRWMDGTLTADADPQRFAAFASLAAKQMGFDPRKRSPQDAAARLAKREKAWAKVWDRFEETNGAYDGVVKLLRLEEPQSLFERRDAYPILMERGRMSCARRWLRSRTRRLKGQQRRSLTLKSGTRGGARRYGRNVAKRGWHKRWSISPWSRKPSRSRRMMRKPSSRPISRTGGWPIGRHCAHSTSPARAKTGKLLPQRCVPSICHGSMPALWHCRRSPATVRYASLYRASRRRRRSGRHCCSWMACAWIWRNSSGPSSGFGAQRSR
jgi:hypothetical protein